MLFYLFTIIVIAIILFVSSFFMSDKLRDLEVQFEQFSITAMQDTYQMKKKISILEEELLADQKIDEEEEEKVKELPRDVAERPKLINVVHEMNERGLSVEEIAQETGLSADHIRTILYQNV